FQNRILLSTTMIKSGAILFFVAQATLIAGTVNWQGPAGSTIKSVNYLKTESVTTESTAALNTTSLQLTEATQPYPVPPLAGFSPLVAITTSDKHVSLDDTFEHELETGYSGNPLAPPVEDNFIIGIFDSGAEVDLLGGSSATTLGLTGDQLTGNLFPIGGVGGTLDAEVTYPVGIFAAGLSSIQSDGKLNPNDLLGHSNVATLVTPEISCSTGESVTGVIGTPFLSFYTTVIRNDYVHKVNIGGQDISGPDVQILEQDDPSIPEYSHLISMEFSGAATTANYYTLDIFGGNAPEWPTLLSAFGGSLPTGGKFVATLFVLEGEPGPLNVVQPMRVMVDTGAQSSIISPAMAANLSLPLEGDFEVDVCGVGGLEPDVPGYYVDYVKINALGGALEFSNAGFVMLDLGLQDAAGNPIDGVLGMNFFWNRNLVFQPNLFGSGFLQVSDPIPYGNADFNYDGGVNLVDFSMLASAWMSSSSDPEYLPQCDMYLDDMIDIKDLEAFLPHWLE
ncbi:MAG: aspartyl protease family protein, partial [Planctomycetota bacterium]